MMMRMIICFLEKNGRGVTVLSIDKIYKIPIFHSFPYGQAGNCVDLDHHSINNGPADSAVYTFVMKHAALEQMSELRSKHLIASAPIATIEIIVLGDAFTAGDVSHSSF